MRTPHCLHRLVVLLLVAAATWAARTPPKVVVRPEQILLHLTTRPDVVSVSFVTRGGVFKSPVIQYGNSSKKLLTTHACTTDAYKTVPAWDRYGAIHTCRITGVANMKRYHYRVGSRIQKVWSAVRNFTARHIDPKVTRIALAGDIGAWNTSTQKVVNALARRNDLAAYVTVGDISYSSKHKGAAGRQEENDKWGAMHQKVLSRIPQVPVYGNHDQYDNNGTVYDRRYNIHVSPGNPSRHWFSLNIGGIHLTVIDNLYDQSATSPMVAWLKKDLARARELRLAGKIQHIVVTGHYPLYMTRPWTAALKVLEPIMVNYGVDLYVCGHAHMYTRTYPVSDLGIAASTSKTNYTNPKGVVHVVVGTGGVPLERTGELSRAAKWHVYRTKDHYGYLLLTSRKGGRLLAEFVDVRGVVHDSFTIVRFASFQHANNSVPVRSVSPSPPTCRCESDETTAEIADPTPAEYNPEMEEENVVESGAESEQDPQPITYDPEDWSADDAVQTEPEGTSEDQSDEEADSEEEEQNTAKIDFGQKFGVATEDSGWLEVNTDSVAGTHCYRFGSNKWEHAVPSAGVYEVKAQLLGNFEQKQSVVLSVEGEHVKAAKLDRDENNQWAVTIAVPVNNGRLTLSSSATSAALCGVSIIAVTGTYVSVEIDPSAPSDFGIDDHDPTTPFVVNKNTIVAGFVKMTRHEASRFIVTSIQKTKNGKLNATVLIRDLPTDDDMSVPDSLAEFSTLSGDALWQRSGLQIERMEVHDSGSELPKAAQISLLTVGSVLLVVAVFVIAVVVYRRRKKQQQQQGQQPSLLQTDHTLM